MNNKNIIKDISLTFLGIGLIALGFIINKNNLSPNKIINIISYISIAIGCGFFGHFMKNIIKHFSLKNNEELVRKIEIDENDERNVLIAEKSKARAYDMMIYMFAALILIFSLMGINKLTIIFLVVAFLSMQAYALYWRFTFEKKM